MCSHLVSVCGRNVIVLCSQVGGCHNEVHVEVGVVILSDTNATIMRTGLASPRDEAVWTTKQTSGMHTGLETLKKRLGTFSKSMGLSLNWEDSGEGSWAFSSSNLESSVRTEVSKSHHRRATKA